MLAAFASNNNEQKAKLDALEKSQAVIEFKLDGTILDANRNFLDVMGYALEEVRGQNHSMFVPSAQSSSNEYKQFWDSLRRGERQTAEYRRIAKGGREVWIQGTYNPVFDRYGKPYKVIKYATDITEEKLKSVDYAGQISAINKSQAIIEFKMDGTILNANENFLTTMGYTLDEIKGKHHSMFVDPEYRTSLEYQQFWASLNRSEFQSAEYKRYGKNGREIWIQASYNPIAGLDGKPCKVVKFATDITDQKMKSVDYAGQIAAINKSQAVIEFRMDGTILNANENFLKTMGYALDEVKGKHHSMFVDPEYRASIVYQQFWAALNRGEYQSGEFKRIGKNGRGVWIQASYNPILGPDGKPWKVVKFASDTTKEVENRLKNERASHVITENIGEIAQAISQASRQSADTASASSQTSANVQAIAAGAEELNASVKEITHSMDKSRILADEAVNNVRQADEATQKLTNAAQAMSGIVELIQNIASQINLLALNATIESARAGEAGKGFAVVANEVKNLANQAKAATDQISQEINGVQKVSGNVADSLTSIKKSIELVREYVTTTAGAVDQQSSVAREMSLNMQTMATAVTAISGNASEIAKATDHANEATLRVKDAVVALSS